MANKARSEKERFSQMYKAVGDEDFEERQKILENYQQIKDNIQNLIDSAGEGGVSIGDLKLPVLKANEVFEGVQRPQEALLDAEILKVVSILGRSAIEKTQSGMLTFKPVEFAEKVISYTSNAESDIDGWQLLGQEFAACYKVTHGLAPLYGALEWKKPETVRRERRARDREEAVVEIKASSQPEETQDKEYKQEDVQRVHEALKNVFKSNDRKPVLMYKFITDPQSFPKTVENMFHLSFLVRDGYCDITLDDKGLPAVSPVGKHQKKRREESGELQSTSQAVADLDLETWEEFIKLMKIREPMIPRAGTCNKRRQSES